MPVLPPPPTDAYTSTHLLNDQQARFSVFINEKIVSCDNKNNALKLVFIMTSIVFAAKCTD